MCAPKLFSKQGQLIALGSNYKPMPTMISDPILLFGATSLTTSVDLQALEANFGAKIGWRPIPVMDGAPSDWDATLSSEFTWDPPGSRGQARHRPACARMASGV